MREGLEAIENAEKRNQETVSRVDVRKEMLKYIKRDDKHGLIQYIRAVESSKPNFQEDLNYALRNAAHFNAINCTSFLAISRYSNILSQGPTSKEIALHAAIRGNHLECVRGLLTGVTTMDYFALAEQLLFDKSNTRPIDLVASLPSQADRQSMADVILEVLSEHRAGCEVSLEAREEICKILTESMSTQAKMSMS